MLEVHVPQLGPGLREVQVVQETVTCARQSYSGGNALYIIETDKTTVEMDSPEARPYTVGTLSLAISSQSMHLSS